MAKKISDLTPSTITSSDWFPIQRSTSNFRLNAQTAINSSISAQRGVTIQAFDSQLTQIGALTGPGVATKTGSTWSITATSSGGNGAADSGKLAKYSAGGIMVAEGFNGNAYISVGEEAVAGGIVTIVDFAGRQANINATTLTTDREYELPNLSGTFWLSETFTTVGHALAAVTNPSAIRFIRVNADNSVSLLDASTFATAIGASAGGAITSSSLTMNTSKLLGRTSVGSGVIQEMSVGTGLSLSALTLNLNGSSSWSGSGDNGKPVIYDATGSFSGTNIGAATLLGDEIKLFGGFGGGSFLIEFGASTLSQSRIISLPDADGVVSLAGMITKTSTAGLETVYLSAALTPSDTDRGDTLVTAIGELVAGDHLKIGPGTYYVAASSLVIPAGCCIEGSGRTVTTIKGDQPNVLFKLNNNVNIRNCKISVLTPLTSGGHNIFGSVNAYSNAIIEDCWILGIADVWNSYGQYNNTSTKVINCIIESWFDTLLFYSGSTGNYMGFFNCEFILSGASQPDASAGLTGPTVSGATNVVDVIGCKMVIGSSPFNGPGNAFVAITGMMNVVDTWVTSAGTGTDLYQTGTGVLKVSSGRGSKTNGGYETTGTITYLGSNKKFLEVAVSDETTNLTTGTAKLTFRMPYAMALSEVRASVNTAPTGSTIIVDINEAGSTIMSATKLSIDASEKTSTTAVSSAVLSDTVLADDAEITIDIDQVGSIIPGKGLKIVFVGSLG